MKKRVPVIYQGEAAECGLACIAMIASHFGHDIDMLAMRQRFAFSTKGTNLSTLMDIASSLKLEGHALRTDLPALARLQLPGILHWSMSHFVVLTSVKNKHVTIIDPAKGERIVEHDELSRNFTGVAAVFQPSADFEVKNEKTDLRLKNLIGNVAGLRTTVIQLLLLTAFLQFFSIVVPVYTQIVIDQGLYQDSFELLQTAFGAVLVLACFYVVAEIARAKVLLYATHSIGHAMTVNLFEKMVRLPLAYFQKRHIGDTVSRFKSVEPIKVFLLEGMVSAALDGFMALTLIAVMYYYSPLLFLFTALFLTINILVRTIFYPQVRKKSERQILAAAKENTVLIETIRLMQTIKSMAKEGLRKRTWLQAQLTLVAKSYDSALISDYMQISQRSLAVFEQITIVFVGAYTVINGNITIGMFIAYMFYSVSFASKVYGLVDTVFSFRLLNVHLARIADIALTEPEVTETSVLQSIELKGAVSANDLTFRYGYGETDVFSGLSLHIEPGESVAIVGPSGCGKTTLIKVLAGLLRPTGGEVLIDQKPVSNQRLRAFRSKIGVVLQDDELLSGAIAQNISFFDEAIDMMKVQACATMAAIHEDIMAMPMQYQTLVGDQGTSLSGGQAQRVYLARALYNDPKILFLDESTSHLDLANEALIVENMKQLDITRIFVAHRPQSINSASRVIDLSASQ